MVNNSVGGESVETVLTVTAPLSAEVEPKQQVVDYGRSATFKCNYKGNPIKQVYWLKDGVNIGHSDKVLRIDSVKKEDKGMYQCFVRNEQESAQATGELKLGGRFDPPEFIKTFQTQVLKGGPSVQMPCIAKGDPMPEVKWFLYDTEIESDISAGVTIGSFEGDNGEVASYLNITQARTKHGGLYKCVASSKVGSVSHEGRLDVHGAPYVRPMEDMKVVAGKTMTVTCPVAGYPISNIVWEREGRQLPINDRQRVFTNGTLIIEDVQRSEDAAAYTCVAKNEGGYSARSDLEVSVMEPPDLLPLTFGRDVMDEGSLAQVSCIAAKGDEPLTLSWTFHGSKISSDSGIIITPVGSKISMLLISSVNYQHNGIYTCTAKNHAGQKSMSTELKVNVPPRWTVEPTDKQFAQGSDAKVDCKADGFPKPQISWKKAAGSQPTNYRDLDNQINSNVKVVDGSLVLKNIQKESEGYYLCKSTNGIGRGLSAVIYISVQAPPSFEIKTRSQTALKGESTVLQCIAKGEKPIGILWNMNNKRLDGNTDPRYTIKEEIRNDGVLSTISVRRTERSDTATFTCVATNAFGSDDTIINLIIQEVPETPSELKVLDKSGRNVKLSWKAPYNGNSNLTRYLIEYKPIKGTWQNDIDRVLVGGEETIAGVFSLRPATSYHFRIVAQNSIGSSGPSDTITIETDQEAPSGPPVDIRLSSADQHTLSVRWKPPLKELWNGDIRGYYVGYKKVTAVQDPYLFETIEFIKERGNEHSLQISNLEVFTQYSIVVQAFNNIGNGPLSEEVTEFTAEGAPSQPPGEVILTPLASSTVLVEWSAPPKNTANGNIKGYKVIYGPSKTWYDPSTHDSKIVPDLKVEIHGLKKFTNYSMQVLAFTNGGDGVRSPEASVTTKEDIPGAPQSVKGLAMTESSILISWQHPEEPNGKILEYTVYIRDTDRNRDIAPKSYKVNVVQMSYHVDNLNQKTRYEFWVTAHTSIGEGAPSAKATIQPTSRIPAKIASFDEIFTVPANRDIKMPCIAVGSPAPETVWKVNEEDFVKTDKMRLLPDGSLHITNVSKDDAGSYKCIVNNKFGQDMVTHTLVVNGPPEPPMVILTAQTTDTITFKLKYEDTDDATPVHGFKVNYKPEFGDWEQKEIGFGTDEFTLQNLWCGQRYQLQVSAYNTIGIGKPSAIVNTRTKGVEPTVPDARRFLEVSAGSVTLHLNAWQDGGCSMLYFMVEYKPRSHKDWTLVSNNVKPGGNFVVLDLNHATWYNLKVTAHNNAGFSTAEYEFATLTSTGGTVSPPYGTGPNSEAKSGFPGIPDWLDLNMIVPVSATVIVVCVGILVVCVAMSRRKAPPLMNPEEYAQFYGAMNTMNGRMVTMRKDGLPYEDMGYVPPPNRKLPPVPGMNSNYNTIDRIKKGKGQDVYAARAAYNTWDPRKSQGPTYDEIPYGDGPGPRGPIPDVPSHYAQVPPVPQRQAGGSIPGQDEDISPYATFHLLGMREEAKNGNGHMNGGNGFQTMPPTPGSGPMTPQHHRQQQQQQQAQTMHARRSMPIQQGGGMQLYDAPNCDYEPPKNFQQNFGNPYDCPEGFYNGSLMSSVGYSQVADYSGVPGQMMTQSMHGQMPPQPHAEYSTDTVIYKGGPPPPANMRGPLPAADDEFPPPPPLRSADTSLNDSNSTTQSNLTSECSEAECDREPLVRESKGMDPSKELTTEEMRKLIERNEIVQTNGLKPYNTVNV